MDQISKEVKGKEDAKLISVASSYKPLYESTNNLHPFDDISKKIIQNNGLTSNVELANVDSGKLQVIIDDSYLEKF